MACFERIRDVVSAPVTPESLAPRLAAGWQMVAIEWRRELPDSEAPGATAGSEDVPYGLRVSRDVLRLEPEPAEQKILALILALLSQDFSYQAIVSDLNEKGFRRRNGAPWTRIAVFNLMPRLIEAGPGLFAAGEWKSLRPGHVRDLDRAAVRA